MGRARGLGGREGPLALLETERCRDKPMTADISRRGCLTNGGDYQASTYVVLDNVRGLNSSGFLLSLVQTQGQHGIQQKKPSAAEVVASK